MNKINQIKIIRLEEVFKITKKSKSWIYDAMQKGVFPKSFKTGCRSIGWLESDIYEFLQALTQEKSQNEIKKLVLALKAKRLEGSL